MNFIIRKASASWKGRPKAPTTGRRALRQLKSHSALLPDPRSHAGPAGLIAAAQAGSFSLALSDELRLKPSATGAIATTATVTLQYLPAGWTIINIHLTVVARLPEVSQAMFIAAAIRAKTTCLVSKLLRVNISMNARLEN